MKKSKVAANNAACELLKVFESHFDTLPSDERAKREDAFDETLLELDKKRKLGELLRRYRESQDPEETKRLADELGVMIFG